MPKLLRLAICALISSTITLSACSVIAQAPVDGPDAGKGSGAEAVVESTTPAPPAKEKAQDPQSDAQNATGTANAPTPEIEQTRTYLPTAPADTLVVSRMIGSGVRTLKDERVGSVIDLIIDGQGQIVAVVIGVGGVLGMGEKNVAVGWNHVKRSGPVNAQVLRIDADHLDLRSAPTFQAPN